MESGPGRARLEMNQDPVYANLRHVKGLHAGDAGARSVGPTRFEGYGPMGSALLVECVTSDLERTGSALRLAFREHGGYLGASGSVAYLFDHVGFLCYLSGSDREALIQVALDAGAERVIDRGDSIEVLTDPQEWEVVRAELRRRGFEPLASEVTERAASTVPLDCRNAEELLQLIGALLRIEGVQELYTNAELAGGGSLPVDWRAKSPVTVPR